MRRIIMERGEWLWWGVLVAMALPLMVFAEVPTLDGPAHVYTAAVLRELIGPDPGIYGQVFRLELDPWPNWAMQAFLAAVGPWLGWATAEKAALLGVFLALPLAYRYLLVRWGGTSVAAGLLIFPLAHHHLLYLGFWNYTLGVAGVLVLAGWVGGTWGGSARMGWGVALLGLGLYFCHPLAWGLGAVAASWVWWRRGSPQGWVWWALVWSPSVLLAGWFVWVSIGQGRPEWLPVGEVLSQALRMDVAEPFRFQVPILALGLGWAVVGVVVLRWGRESGVLRERAGWALVLGMVSLGLCVALPEAGAGGSLVAYRLTWVPWLWILAAGGLLLQGALGALRRGMAGLALAASAASLVSLTGVLRDYQAGAAAVRHLLAQVGDDEVMEVRMDPAWRTGGRWRTAVWEHAAGRVVQGGRRVAWINAYQVQAHGFPVRRLEGARAAPDVVLVWGAAQAPQGWRLVAETKEPRAGLWRRSLEDVTTR